MTALPFKDAMTVHAAGDRLIEGGKDLVHFFEREMNCGTDISTLVSLIEESRL